MGSSTRAESFIPQGHLYLNTAPVVILIAILLMAILVTPGRLVAMNDSLAYIFRQDNLSSTNDLQLSYTYRFSGSDLLVNDVLKYKVFAFESNRLDEEQYSIEHRLRSEFTWGRHRSKSIRLESAQHEDHRTGLASTIDNWALLLGLKQDNNLSLFIGGRSVERYGLVDHGWAGMVDVHRLWQTAQQRSMFSLAGTRDQLSNHLNHSLRLKADYLIRFGSISTFQTSIFREARLQAFYTDSLGSSQSRNNESLTWQNFFTYDLRKNLRLSHRLDWGDQLTEISREQVDQNATLNLSSEDRNRFSLVNETSLELNNPQFSSQTSFKIENSQNKYYVDYTQVLYQIKESMLWEMAGPLDSLQWISSLSRLEYDTPDTTNDDDRDEWRLNTELRVVWEPTPFYRLDFGSKLGLFHLIYLFDTRSSENHWNRNLVFWTGLSWRRDRWEGKGRGRIRSNYFDYDYDDLFIELELPSRSFVHRSLDLKKTLNYHLSHRWTIHSKLAFRWEDEGKLKWDAFIQEVNSRREQTEASIELDYSFRGWTGRIGHLTHRRDIIYADENRESDRWRGAGPMVGVNYKVGNRINLRGDARFLSVEDGERAYVLPKVFFTLVYR